MFGVGGSSLRNFSGHADLHRKLFTLASAKGAKGESILMSISGSFIRCPSGPAIGGDGTCDLAFIIPGKRMGYTCYCGAMYRWLTCWI